MKILATLLLIGGTIVATFGAAKLPEANPLVTGLGLLLLSGGGVILFLLRRKLAQVPAGAGASADVLKLMRELPDKLQPILDQADQLTLAQLGERIGELDVDYFRVIADGAPELLAPMGTERFAEVFGVYASGERYVSRAWSASVDHHRPETVASLCEGIARIRQAVEALEKGTVRAA
jgi:hypothetical protein